MTNPLVKEITDAGQRASDIINTHIAGLGLVNAVGYWVALRLSDGGSDNIVYRSRKEAVRGQLHETMCAYVQIPPDGADPKEMTAFLRVVRRMYDQGHRFADPADDPTITVRKEL